MGQTGQKMVANSTGHENMDFAAWVEQYRPMQHPGGKAPFDNMMYTTTGRDWDQIQAQDPRRVWTLVEYDSWLGLVPGRRFVNRLGYFVTNRPWDNEHLAITITTDDDSGKGADQGNGHEPVLP